MRAHIGTSGWQYDSWRSSFYEREPRRAWLEHYGEVFPTVEVNSTFYGTPSKQAVAAWREAVPDDFVFAVKVSRFVTHIKQLRDAENSVRRFLRTVEPLGKRMGPALLQLPPTMPVHLDRLQEVVEAFPRSQRIAVEFREASWFCDEVREYLESRNVALVLADRESRPVTPLWRTTNWGYLRMHDGRAKPRPHYGDGSLHAWVKRLRKLWPGERDVFVFFNNDTGGWAPRDAERMRSMLRTRELANSEGRER